MHGFRLAPAYTRIFNFLLCCLTLIIVLCFVLFESYVLMMYVTAAYGIMFLLLSSFVDVKEDSKL